MRRIKLVWFALGAGTVTCLFLASNWLFRSTVIEHNWTAYLVLTEPLSENEASNGNESDDMSLIANNTGRLLRDCGARVFETTFLYNDHMPTADYPIIPENYDSLECVIKAVQDQGIRFDVEVRSPPRAADEIEVGN